MQHSVISISERRKKQCLMVLVSALTRWGLCNVMLEILSFLFLLLLFLVFAFISILWCFSIQVGKQKLVEFCFLVLFLLLLLLYFDIIIVNIFINSC